MIQSMTGFGRAVTQFPNKNITIEIRTLNSKGLDLFVRIPSALKEVENTIRTMIAQHLERGKVEVSIVQEFLNEETSAKINSNAVKNYIYQLKEILPNADEVELLKMAVRMPDALKTDKDEIDETENKSILAAAEKAIQEVVKFRNDEGLILIKEFEKRIQKIDVLLQETLEFEKERKDLISNKLRLAVTELNATVDENRFEQELIYYLEKLDVTEEKVRLSNHLKYFLEALHEKESNGKKLGFIAQEIGREINTLGSKANHAAMQQKVVMMKDELEKIKEQLLNIL
jgi:uncharacterized protein (TIGR00255 family)